MSTLESQRTALPTGTWTSDPTHSTIDFTVKHMLVGKFRASVPTFSATLVVDGEGSSLEGTAAVASIVAADENLTAPSAVARLLRRRALSRDPLHGDLDRGLRRRGHRGRRADRQGHHAPDRAEGRALRPGDRSVRRRAHRPRPDHHVRPHQVRTQLQRPDAERRVHPVERRACHRPARAHAQLMPRVLALSGSLRAGSHSTALLRAAAARAGDDLELILYDGLRAIPPFDEDVEREGPEDRGRRPSTRCARRCRRRPDRDARVQRLGSGRAEERARLGLAPVRDEPASREAGRRDQREHGVVRRTVGPERPAPDPRDARRAGDRGQRDRAARAHARRRGGRARPSRDERRARGPARRAAVPSSPVFPSRRRRSSRPAGG